MSKWSVNILLIGWWWGHWDSASSSFCFQSVWESMCCRLHTVNFFHLPGVSVSEKELEGHGSEYCFGEGNGNPPHYSCLENPVDRGAWWAAVHGVTQSRTRLKRLSTHAYMHWRRNGNPLQYSFLENPRDRGARWAAIYGVAQSQTWLTRFSSSSSRILFIALEEEIKVLYFV